MHCNLRPPEPRQPLPALITTLCQVWNRKTYLLQYYSIFAADTLLYAVILTFDLWPWTFAAYRLWRDETLHKIWMQSNNLRRSYCDFSDLEHCVTYCGIALGCGIIFTEFDSRQLNRTWTIAFFDADTLCHAVTLTFDLMALNFYSISGVMRLNCTKFERNRIIHGWVIDDLVRFRVQF